VHPVAAPPMDEAGPPVHETPVSNEGLPEAAPALETVPQGNAEKEIQSAPSAHGKTRRAVWGAALSAWVFTFADSVKRLGARAGRGTQNEAGGEAGLEAEGEGSGSNVKEFNPIPEPAESAKSSQEIFNDLGQELRQRREMLSLAIEEVERHIHVRAAFLRALEQGALEELPSTVQTRGMFVNYASFLDLDVDSLLLRFADGLQARHRERHPQKRMRGRPIKVNEKVPSLSTFIAGDLLIGGGMIILLILFTIWGVSRVVVMRSQYYPQATAPAITNILAETPEPTAQSQLVTLIPAQNTPSTATPLATVITSTLPANINVEINIVAVGRTYMRVSVDGKIQFDGQTVPGTAYPYEAKKQVEVLVGSASGLSMTYNGSNLGLMGTFGQVVDNIYTAQGVLTPTASPVPTNTAAPGSSATPTRTPSVTPTPTPSGG